MKTSPRTILKLYTSHEHTFDKSIRTILCECLNFSIVVPMVASAELMS